MFTFVVKISKLGIVVGVVYSGNANGWSRLSSNEVTLRRARLVPGWVTACRQVNHLIMYYVTSHPGQLSLLPSVGR